MLTRLRWSSLLLLGVLIISAPARAQSGAVFTLSQPQTVSFPVIQTYLDAHTIDGQFIHGLQTTDIRIQENGGSLSIDELEEMHPGLQLVIAVNPGPSFDVRSSQGVSRYEALASVLAGWATGRLGSNIDDLNVIISGGPERTHFSDPAQLSSTLLEFTYTDDGTTLPGLDTLSRGVDIASDPTPRPGMERAILFITAPLQGDASLGLQTLAARIQQQGIHLFIWYVTNAQLFDTPQALQLADLGLQSGGQFFPFSGEQDVPNPEVYFNGLRHIYRITFTSRSTAGGTQNLVAEIALDGQMVQSLPLSYELELLPPDPAFILPSLEILRQPPEELRNNLWKQVDPQDLQPDEQMLQVLVDFPDGRIRSLVRTALYVDNTLVDENISPPFDFFTWDLQAYTTSGQHVLKVEALDSLGLTGTSIDTPVQVNVELPAPNPLRSLAQRWPALAGLGVLLVAALLFLGLLLVGKINPGWQRLRRGLSSNLRRQAIPPQPANDANPEASRSDGRRLPEWTNRFHWPQRRLNPRAHAYLTPVSDTDGSNTPAPISITTDEITFGADPQRATLMLDDGSVEALHARLVREPDGSFLLTDEGSVAGTWINYSPVSPQGTVLEQGDLIHLGRVCFRFTQREPRRVRTPVFILQEPDT